MSQIDMDQTDRLQAYCHETLRFAKVLNLTSIHDEQAFMSRFVQPSVALSGLMPDQGRMLDVGSGMGVPGIPLLLVKPDVVGVLVERRKKRAEFLRHLVRMFELNAEVYDADLKDLAPLNADICVARAVTRAEDLLNMCSPHVRDGAQAVLPVPRQADIACADGWTLSDTRQIEAGDVQYIQCYQFRIKQ